MTDIDKGRAKHAIRECVWTLLEQQRAVPQGTHGRIPAFYGAEVAADRLAQLPVWKNARIVKTVPDKAQLPVRARALEEGKLVYMAVPELAEEKPFYLLDPAELTVPASEAASSEVAAAVAQRIGLEKMRPVDLVVCGSVAVNRHGVRLGKGAGYFDIELALLQEANLIGPKTIVATTVHSLQVIDEELPETEHDFSVDLVVTPDEVIECGSPRRPNGLIWKDLDQEKIAAIPVLAALAEKNKTEN
ncbi:5-formyltetrahydrofolate cyclo-ligase [Nocardia paucivorans]|uniref:5-formyltetrahydrofolate cyclo-ligase n=1 Tax=Nocardia paucivorans TaxID=114259 RepID=UPI0002FB9E89|nr:5-formyltetrahydrofolate cyclo-ligase [Nocardia paucivorans]